MFDSVSSKPDFPILEERILAFWREQRIFQKSIEQRRDSPLFTFYEGPPTVNASPGIHHVLSRVFKDIFPRYKAMKGYWTPRKAGWDTHGLPVELGVEEELGFSSKTQIEAYGIERFNQKCRRSVSQHIKEWENLTERIGFWIDMDHPYVTFDNDYIESCWWLIKQLWDKGLIYQGYKVTPHCPRCGTSLSSHEVALGYKDTEDPSVYVKFQLVSRSPEGDHPDVYRRLCTPKGAVYFLAWTTTPWTLPGNTALAVAPDAEYAVVECPASEEQLILAEALVENVLRDNYRVIDRVRGDELAGLEYEPLFRPSHFDVPAQRLGHDCGGELPETYPVISGDFVSLEEGTGIVHIAPAFGEVDYEAGITNRLYFVQPVDTQGRFTGSYPFAGLFVKDADRRIIKDLRSRGQLHRDETIRHTYPFCWRCETPLLYYAKPSWYIRTTAVKDKLIAGNKEINWYPEHIKHGRFGDWLENNVDWAFSRERYWGTPIPIWRCEACGETECIGGFEELKSKTGVSGIKDESDFHRPYADEITFTCKCGKPMLRVPEVIDCWFDSGAMPFAQWHYPFENQSLRSDGRFPADFICEAVDQTRGWFYSLHALAVCLFDQPCFRNVICLGHILDGEGEKMSKSKGNVVEPWQVIQSHGADALRWYLVTSSPPGNVRRFSNEAIVESMRRFLLRLWNTYSFFVTYANIDRFDPRESLERRSELDRWIISELNQLTDEVSQAMDRYDPTGAGRKIEGFVDDLSNWYIRRSRRRFWKSENDADKQAAHLTLYECLTILAGLLAPLTPFVAEEMYQNLVCSRYPEAPQSVHLLDFPTADRAKIDAGLSADTKLVMKVAHMGRSARSKAGIKVRQPLSKAVVKVKAEAEGEGLRRLEHQILDELNVKGMMVITDEGDLVDFEIKPNLTSLGPRYGRELPRIAAALAELDPREVVPQARAGGKVQVCGYDLLPEDILISTRARPGYAIADDGGYIVGISTEISPDLAEEGLARELVHRLQTMRRSAEFDIADYIQTYYQGGATMQQVMKKFASYIKQETLSRELTEGAPPDGVYLEQHKIDGNEVVLAVKRCESG
ncbi:isoleucine--tRNA ligase [Dehalococcoidia bacterium]|nr:isoleucine--tRNA ligase [Dehalococcoidia bacterium]